MPMDAVEITVIAILGVLGAVALTWLLMRLIIGGMAKRIVGAVREFIQRARRDRRRAPRDTPDRRRDPDPLESNTASRAADRRPGDGGSARDGYAAPRS